MIQFPSVYCLASVFRQSVTVVRPCCSSCLRASAISETLTGVTAISNTGDALVNQEHISDYNSNLVKIHLIES